MRQRRETVKAVKLRHGDVVKKKKVSEMKDLR